MNNDNKIKNNSVKIIIIIIGALVGILLLVFGSYTQKEDAQEEDTISKDDFSVLDADAYAEELEERISLLCEQMSGVDKVSVTVTLSGGYNAVYAQNSQSGGSGYKNEFVLTGSGSSERALLIGYSAPQISGVGIVCRGGGSLQTKGEIIALVSAAFGVSTNKIYVAEAKS